MQAPFEKAKAFRAENSHTHIDTMAQLEQHLAESEENGTIPGWILAGWCGEDACEEDVKEKQSLQHATFRLTRRQQSIHAFTAAKKHNIRFGLHVHISFD